jgi:hypothetical protein
MEKPTPDCLGFPGKNAFCDQAFDLGSYCQRSERQESPGLMKPPTRYPMSPITQALAPVLARPVNSALFSQLPLVRKPSQHIILGLQEYTIKKRLMLKTNFSIRFRFIEFLFLNLLISRIVEMLNTIHRI